MGSKWTAVVPVDREKHFVVVGQRRMDAQAAEARELALQAVTSKRTRWVLRQELEDEAHWLRGWR